MLLAAVVAVNTVDCLKLMLSPDDRSPYRPFRERGFQSLITTLNQQLTDSDLIIAPKDVGRYVRARSYALEAARDFEGAEAIVQLVRQERITHGVDSVTNPALLNTETLFRQAGLSNVQFVGDFAIYSRPR